MDIVIKSSAVAVIAALCILLIKKSNQELALTVSIAVTAVICFAAVGMISEVVELVRYAIDCTGLSEAVFMPIIKCTGIAMIVHISTGLCRDAGQSSIASSIEVAGSAAALFTALPLIRSLLNMIGGLI